MKITARNINAFLGTPPATIAAVLFYGHDMGLIDEYAHRLAKHYADDIDDPFCVSHLTPEAVAADPALLRDSAAALPPMGGRRLVLVRGGGAGLLAATRNLLANPPAESMVIITANDTVNTRTPLVKFFEQSDAAAAIGCYPDSDGNIRAMAQDAFAQAKISTDGGVLDWIAGHLGANRMVSRMEVEKLILLAGAGGHLTLAQTQQALSDGASISTSDIIAAAAGGDYPALGQALDRAKAEALEGERIIRNALAYFSRLARLNALISTGMSRGEAIKAYRPPIFFTEQRQIESHLNYWSQNRSRRAIDRLAQAEHQARTGIDAFVAVSQALLSLASRGRR